MDYKKLDLDVIIEKEKEDLLSIERRKLFKKAGKLIYTTPIVVLMSNLSNAGLTPPDPPDSTTQASQQDSFNNDDDTRKFF